MNARERRALVLKDRPKIRRIDVTDDRDIGIMWADYQRNPIPPGLTQDTFAESFKQACAFWDSVYFVEDFSKAFRAGRGPVGLIKIKTNGWRIEPEARVFAWATPKNILRSAVAFFQMVKHDRTVGACVVFAHENAKSLLDRMFHYDVLFRAGRVRDGIPGAVAHVYVIKGKREPERDIRDKAPVLRPGLSENSNPAEESPSPDAQTQDRAYESADVGTSLDQRRRLDPWA